MQIDLFGKKRFKVNLHTHTTHSDGRKTPEEAIACYKAAGYDAIALTDHWYFGKGYDADGLTVLSGAEYNTPTQDCREGVYHIVGVGMRYEPSLTRDASPQKIIDEIHAAGGLADIAHPAWSLNTPAQIMALQHIDYTEIYNTVSGLYMSRRPDSSLIIDMLAAEGRVYPLVADDDTHHYDGDECVSYIMVEAEDNSPASLLPAIREGRFYASQGPEIHMWREENEMVVRSSPVCEVVFHSNLVWAPRVFRGEALTEVRYKLREKESFIRAEVIDRDGKHAWSNIITIE